MINFPDVPTLNQVHTDAIAGCTWKWDGVKWMVDVTVIPDFEPQMITVSTTTTLATGFSGFVGVDNTTGAPMTVTLPTGPMSPQRITVKDIGGNAGTYPITVAGNGQNIENASSLILRGDYNWVDLIYTGAKWVQT
jgi:hypothetical protein